MEFKRNPFHCPSNIQSGLFTKWLFATLSLILPHGSLRLMLGLFILTVGFVAPFSQSGTFFPLPAPMSCCNIESVFDLILYHNMVNRHFFLWTLKLWLLNFNLEYVPRMFLFNCVMWSTFNKRPLSRGLYCFLFGDYFLENLKFFCSFQWLYFATWPQ